MMDNGIHQKMEEMMQNKSVALGYQPDFSKTKFKVKKNVGQSIFQNTPIDFMADGGTGSGNNSKFNRKNFVNRFVNKKGAKSSLSTEVPVYHNRSISDQPVQSFTYKKSGRKGKKGTNVKSPVNIEAKDWDFLSYKHPGQIDLQTQDNESKKKPHSNRIKAHQIHVSNPQKLKKRRTMKGATQPTSPSNPKSPTNPKRRQSGKKRMGPPLVKAKPHQKRVMTRPQSPTQEEYHPENCVMNVRIETGSVEDDKKKQTSAPEEEKKEKTTVSEEKKKEEKKLGDGTR